MRDLTTKDHTPRVTFRLTREDRQRLETIRLALGVRDTTEALRYAIRQIEKMVRQ